jgi:antitoxin (DNA-binding transcriptional repressor) of toxin-antitoxin stability system
MAQPYQNQKGHHPNRFDTYPTWEKDSLQTPIIDMALYMAIIMAMKTTTIVELKDHLSDYLQQVENGEEFEVRRRNTLVARITPPVRTVANHTQLGAGRKTGKILGELCEPLIPHSDWGMLS